MALLVAVVIGGGALFAYHDRKVKYRFTSADSWRANGARWKPGSPVHLLDVVLLGYRAAALLWALFILQSTYPGHLFWYTLWNFVMLTAYFAVAFSHSLWGVLVKRGRPTAGQEEAAGLLQKLLLVLCGSIAPAPCPAPPASSTPASCLCSA